MSPDARDPLRLEYSNGGVVGASDNSVAAITLNDPDRHNALGRSMFDALERALADVQRNCGMTLGDLAANPDFSADAPTRVVVLCAKGLSFCSGFDLRTVANDADPAQPVLADFLSRLNRCIETLSQLPAITIAAVQGVALAGGCALVSACDFVIATPNAQFGYPTHAIGLSPAVSGPTLASRVGLGPARRLMLGGQLVDGTRAFEIGLASQLVATTLEKETEALTGALLSKGPHALRATKWWLRQLDPLVQKSHRANSLAASLSGVGGSESIDRVAAIWKKRASDA
ncbi:MAG: enoyl-CoA hydratase/isomerase family protein [Planctomycetes bacterium]|nr:enoyl-CoA hydratase/isomerase family protein [Planctomycetota bacterium]